MTSGPERDLNAPEKHGAMVHYAIAYSYGGGVCPEQYEGKLINGENFYFRIRFGVASLTIGDIDSVNTAPDDHVWKMCGTDNMRGWWDSDAERNAVFEEFLGRLRPGVFATVRPGP